METELEAYKSALANIASRIDEDSSKIALEVLSFYRQTFESSPFQQAQRIKICNLIAEANKELSNAILENNIGCHHSSLSAIERARAKHIEILSNLC